MCDCRGRDACSGKVYGRERYRAGRGRRAAGGDAGAATAGCRRIWDVRSDGDTAVDEIAAGYADASVTSFIAVLVEREVRTRLKLRPQTDNGTG